MLGVSVAFYLFNKLEHWVVVPLGFIPPILFIIVAQSRYNGGIVHQYDDVFYLLLNVIFVEIGIVIISLFNGFFHPKDKI